MKTVITGTPQTYTATFTIDGIPVDPTTVTFITKIPAGGLTTYQYGVNPEIVKEATGVYSLEVPMDTDGIWQTRVQATGVGASAEEDAVFAKSNFV